MHAAISPAANTADKTYFRGNLPGGESIKMARPLSCKIAASALASAVDAMKTDDRPSTVVSVFPIAVERRASFTRKSIVAVNPFHLYLYGPGQGPIEASFEEAESRLNELPKLHFEPDGSFVWALESGRQQIFGMLYDAGGMIRYCELRGRCTLPTWRELCHAIAGAKQEGLEVLLLPGRRLQDLHSFEANCLAETQGGSD
jgi:hypothetical protein